MGQSIFDTVAYMISLRPLLYPHIVRNPAILGGKPIIAGTRISVELILELIAAGRTPEDIVEGYPSLTKELIAEAVSSSIRLTDEELRQARASFETDWAKWEEYE